MSGIKAVQELSFEEYTELSDRDTAFEDLADLAGLEYEVAEEIAHGLDDVHGLYEEIGNWPILT